MIFVSIGIDLEIIFNFDQVAETTDCIWTYRAKFVQISNFRSKC